MYPERQVGDQIVQDLSEVKTKALLGKPLLVEGIFCEYGCVKYQESEDKKEENQGLNFDMFGSREPEGFALTFFTKATF